VWWTKTDVEEKLPEGSGKILGWPQISVNKMTRDQSQNGTIFALPSRVAIIGMHTSPRGGMCEWLKQAVLKTALP
jgi:hypothetical protein